MYALNFCNFRIYITIYYRITEIPKDLFSCFKKLSFQLKIDQYRVLNTALSNNNVLYTQIIIYQSFTSSDYLVFTLNVYVAFFRHDRVKIDSQNQAFLKYNMQRNSFLKFFYKGNLYHVNINNNIHPHALARVHSFSLYLFILYILPLCMRIYKIIFLGTN